MKVYVLRSVLGKVANYDQNGKLKNQTITAKYGEMELENALTDQNWKKIGACEITCVNAYNHPDLTTIPEMVDSINERIKKDIQQGIRPKSEIELLKEQIAALTEKINNPVLTKEVDTTEKEIRKLLFEEAEQLGLSPAKNVKTDILKDLIAKAKD